MVKIYVGKLTSGVTNANLRSLFEPFGTVTDAERVRNKDIGFVHMDNEREAALAVRWLMLKVAGVKGLGLFESRMIKDFHI